MQSKKCISTNPAVVELKKSHKGLTDTLNVLEAINRPFVKNKITISPQPFFDESFGLDRKNILNSSDKIKWKFVREKNNCVSIKPELNPKTLEITDELIPSEHISNLSFPFGSLAISSDLDKTLSTDDLWQCAAVSVVDKMHDLQTLIHFCPSVPTAVNEKLIEHILEVSKPKDIEVTIVPGCYADTDLTIDYLVNKITDFSKGAKIKFANFPDEKHHTVILKNGKLSAAENINVIKNTNPVDKLSVATSFFV
jgi:hypothetical protein